MTLRILLAFLVLLLFIVLLRGVFRPVVVYEFERGLRYARGKFTGILTPGLYWSIKHLSEVRKVDIRPVIAPVAGQEVLSSDGVALKVSLAAKYEITDPALAINRIENFKDALHVELQLALRQIVGGKPIDDLLAARQEMGATLQEIVAEKTPSFGLKLLNVEIRDIMFPGELKKIFTQVVRARQEGLAALERARGETAALRNLANAAQLVERNPYLMQLRLLQVLGTQSGNTVVLGLQPPSGPIPIRQPGEGAIDTRVQGTGEPGDDEA
ncbi:MAG TPA: slipin family protein [Vicinamibacteria bacterium]|nr:slipin family protein [Vicinamibacteria bacterium]